MILRCCLERFLKDSRNWILLFQILLQELSTLQWIKNMKYHALMCWSCKFSLKLVKTSEIKLLNLKFYLLLWNHKYIFLVKTSVHPHKTSKICILRWKDTREYAKVSLVQIFNHILHILRGKINSLRTVALMQVSI